ncbi:MAG TPA: hypothetical protein VN822_08880 [Candidatus Acidoferrales bacterium]|nr:hypothetical protein [Candidatus Acidoferrales bacterium]
MSHRPLVLLAAFCLVTSVAPAARAQSDSAPQSAQPSSPATQAASTPPATKKVWTNDDVTGLRSESTISTVGDSNAGPAKPVEKPAAAGKNRDPKWYQDQIAKLRAQIPPLDSQIVELQAAIDGKPTGNGKESARPRGVKADDWSVEMTELQKKRDGIVARISGLEDEARHNGVAANALP